MSPKKFCKIADFWSYRNVNFLQLLQYHDITTKDVKSQTKQLKVVWLWANFFSCSVSGFTCLVLLQVYNAAQYFF